MKSDKELVKGLMLNDRKAFEEFVEIYSRDILKTISYILNDSSEKDYIEECFDDIIIQIWENSNKFKFECSFRTWVICIAKNKALDYKRKLKKHFVQVAIDETISDKINLENEYLNKELSEEISNVVKQLSDKDRTLFIKRYILNIPIKHLCKEYIISESILYKRLSRIRERIRKKLTL